MLHRERTTEVEFYTDGHRFADTIEPLVARDRVGATMVSHVLAGHLDVPYPRTPLLVLVRDDDRVAVAALRTPPHPMLVVADPGSVALDGVDPDNVDPNSVDLDNVDPNSVDPDGADPAAVLDELAAAVIAGTETVVGFSGRRHTVEQLAAAWTARTGNPCRTKMRTLFHRLAELIEPVGVPGAPRAADVQDAADVDLLARWFVEFRLETGVSRGPLTPDPDAVRQGAARGEHYTFWCVDGVPVAVAGRSAVRGGRARIAPVYTPPDRRRLGFGSAATAATVTSARAAGATEITLFTDADYEPSNLVYRALGFEVIGEFAEFEIVESE